MKKRKVLIIGGGIADNIRYTHNWRESFEGFAPTPIAPDEQVAQGGTRVEKLLNTGMPE